MLEGKIALVTGASRGSAKAICRNARCAGATVIGTATTEGGAEAITQRFADKGHQGQGCAWMSG